MIIIMIMRIIVVITSELAVREKFEEVKKFLSSSLDVGVETCQPPVCQRAFSCTGVLCTEVFSLSRSLSFARRRKPQRVIVVRGTPQSDCLCCGRIVGELKIIAFL